VIDVSGIDAEHVCNLYSRERNFLDLGEKYKVLELKELEMIKQLRKLNTDRINLVKTCLQNEKTTASAATTAQNSVTTSSTGVVSTECGKEDADLNTNSKHNNNNTTNTTNTTTTTTNNNNNALLNIRCCSCAKSILTSICANEYSQCKLCLGLFHGK
jgi:hypothetical protein